jgi:hypothetical protein
MCLAGKHVEVLSKALPNAAICQESGMECGIARP